MKNAKLLAICTIYYHYSLFVSNLYHYDIARTSLQRDDGAWFQTWKAIVILSVKKKKYIKAWLNVSDEQGVLWWHTKIRCHKHFVTSVTSFWLLGTENECSNKQCNIAHHSSIDDECQIQSAKNLALPDERLLKTIQGIPPKRTSLETRT